MEIVIRCGPAGNLEVTWPRNNLAGTIGLLELAKSAIVDEARRAAEGPRIEQASFSPNGGR